MLLPSEYRSSLSSALEAGTIAPSHSRICASFGEPDFSTSLFARLASIPTLSRYRHVATVEPAGVMSSRPLRSYLRKWPMRRRQAPPAVRKAWCQGRECLDELLVDTLAAHGIEVAHDGMDIVF